MFTDTESKHKNSLITSDVNTELWGRDFVNETVTKSDTYWERSMDKDTDLLN